MPNIDDLKEQISIAENKLKVLAKQNTDYNAEIVKLKSEKDKAISDHDVALKDLERVINSVSIKQAELNGILSDIEKQRDNLKSIESARTTVFNEAVKEKSALTDVISRLRSDKVALENEIASLQNKSFNAGITINTQNFTIEENNLRINKTKTELSSVELKLSTAKMELDSIINRIKEKNEELQARIDILILREKELLFSIDKKTKEVFNIQSIIDKERSDFNIDIKSQKDALAIEKKSIEDAKLLNEQNSKQNDSLRQALADREQELKLLELKIKELARKKDIDAQIASLSK